ncbi:MAG: uroporphyrinogen-III synthase [Actinobacteria bacterium]|nr:uroporphyrinogen-III synthase [Actinomycetota bacterium]
MTRVAITTAADRFSRLAESARRQGLHPVPLPCIEVIAAPAEVLEAARELARRADWLVLTSARTVEILWPEGEMPSVPVAAVGPATAAAAGAAGGGVGLVGESGGEDLIAELSEMIEGATVFFPHASGADRATTTAPGDSAVQIEAMPVYETRPIAPGPDRVDAVVFGSPSAVRGWGLSRSFAGLTLAAIGETTAAALAESARPADLIAPRPDFDDLMGLLAKHTRQRSRV